MPYIPKLGAGANSNFGLQFQAATFDSLSFRTTPVELLDHQNPSQILSHATGFFWRIAGQAYLITNRHVVSGRNSFDDTYVVSSFRPHKLRIYLGQWVHPPGTPASTRRFDRVPVDIELYSSGQAVFYEDPQFPSLRVDVVAIPIDYKPEIERNKFSPFLNEFKFEPLKHFVGADIFVVGYPYHSYEGMMIPIWKRGTLAHEPLFPLDSKPMFLIDALTRSGMSGSPVFRRVFGPAPLADGSLKLDSIVTTEFVGIYSGRMGSVDLEHAAVGLAWYANRIPMIINSKNRPTESEVHPV